MAEQEIERYAAFDSLLREALLEANRRDWAALPDAPWETSERFQRSMRKLLASPFGYAHRAARPVWKKALIRAGQIAACLLLVGSVTLAVSPAARAWVERLVVEWFDVNTNFRFYGSEEEASTAAWRCAYVPEGYQEAEVNDSLGAGYGTIWYRNEMGDEFVLDYMPAADGNFFNADNEHSDYLELELNGCPAYLLRSNTADWPSFLIWTDKSETVAFQLMGELEAEELLRIAEGVEPLK